MSRAPAAAASRPDPETVEVWIFDLDNTLYPAASDVMGAVSRRMTRFIQDQFDLGFDDARTMQRHFFLKYGTTLKGLMLEHGVDPNMFLDYVHAVDLTPILEAEALGRAMARLPGRKLVYTNADARHAGRVLARLGLARHVEAIWDIEAAGWEPKPEPAPYRRLVERHGIRPERAVMVEDIARNLRPAHALGMTTVWLSLPGMPPQFGPDGAYVDHVIDDLAGWLSDLYASAD